MNIHTLDRAQVFAKEVKAASVGRSKKGSQVLVEDSDFSEVPQGSKVTVKSLSFSKLQTGDFILANLGGQSRAFRFLRVKITSGITKLLVADAQSQEQSIPFPCLMGQVIKVRKNGESLDPNPSGFFQRMSFRLRHRLAR